LKDLDETCTELMEEVRVLNSKEGNKMEDMEDL
jgi:hypothetical protein